MLLLFLWYYLQGGLDYKINKELTIKMAFKINQALSKA